MSCLHSSGFKCVMVNLVGSVYGELTRFIVDDGSVGQRGHQEEIANVVFGSGGFN